MMTEPPSVITARGNTVAGFELDAVADAIAHDHFPLLSADDPMLLALLRVLSLVDWNRSADSLLRALPHAPGKLTAADLRSTLSRLGISSKLEDATDATDPTGETPQILVVSPQTVLIRSGASSTGAQIVDVSSGQPFDGVLPKGTQVISLYAPADQADSGFVGGVLRRFQKTWLAIFLLRGLGTLCSIAIALSVISVYDMVIPSGATDTLIGLTAGVIFLSIIDHFTRRKRVSLSAHITARIEYLIATLSFRKVFSMPLHRLLSGSVAQQVGRLRQFSGIASSLTAPVTEVVLALPFSIVIFCIMFWLAGAVAFIPLVSLVAFAGITAMLLPRLRLLETQARIARDENSQMTTELVMNAAWIRCAGTVEGWRERAMRAALLHAAAHRRAGVMHGLVSALCASSVPITGGLVAIVGAAQVIAGALTPGALLGVVILSWRILAPLQTALMMGTRASEVFRLREQLDRLMALPDGNAGANAPVRYDIQGTLAFKGVSLRYAGATALALQGVSAHVPQGTMVAITGGSGAGKTSLLRLVAGAYAPLSGDMLIDGVNILQIPSAQIRHFIAYVPSDPVLIHGSVAQNLRLGTPLAPQHELMSILDELGLRQVVENLPDGVNTRLTAAVQSSLPTGFVKSLTVAQALLTKPKVLLLDEPARSLDPALETAMMSALERRKGEVTTLMVTHRPSHIRASDIEIRLNLGRVESLRARKELSA